ncbi:unnamed protein product [Bursaphelenchus okinawaensis]|uniref:Uncharacterized protein n=1 Tax=Bursaphelenchus okinawaensis TaxID=465554 RepID=A0A811LS65_9BILA|nr:unnamed protein product [Bursaphelenchus okinawaensis]CAG9127620.1 unnamed protein product [Bursaphelenchus okinawaensis]
MVFDADLYLFKKSHQVSIIAQTVNIHNGDQEPIKVDESTGETPSFAVSDVSSSAVLESSSSEETSSSETSLVSEESERSQESTGSTQSDYSILSTESLDSAETETSETSAEPSESLESETSETSQSSESSSTSESTETEPSETAVPEPVRFLCESLGISDSDESNLLEESSLFSKSNSFDTCSEEDDPFRGLGELNMNPTDADLGDDFNNLSVSTAASISLLDYEADQISEDFEEVDVKDVTQ